jgi:acyl-CoA thioester hydrolase
MQIPYESYRVSVPPEWIDIIGHMNSTRYGLVVFEGQKRFCRAIGLGERYVERTGCGNVVIESHLLYEREVALGDELAVVSWLLGVDSKRLHFFHEVLNLTKGVRAAAAEQVDIHFDLEARRSAPFPLETLQHLQGVVREFLSVPKPAKVGSRLRPPANDWLEAEQDDRKSSD